MIYFKNYIRSIIKFKKSRSLRLRGLRLSRTIIFIKKSGKKT